MNKPLTIRKVGNSLNVTISYIAKDLGLGEGDKMYAVRTPRGLVYGLAAGEIKEDGFATWLRDAAITR